ncbi:MAG: hypothetical protein EWV76_01760 [Microcystis novacekii Mn_MB_F_20050700_S1]|nr:MAG: hypothetical protein EWV76_01760 [Microcystis novacekii Mn_MB_F_20050700_S1]
MRLFGLCYAMNGGYRGCNPCIERHLAIFVNYFCLERTNQLRPSNEEPKMPEFANPKNLLSPESESQKWKLTSFPFGSSVVNTKSGYTSS